MTDKPQPASEGFVSFRGHNVWYRIVGARDEPGKFPLLCLHGGPGATHDYLEPLETMASTGRRVILYDQLGNGNSSHPHNSTMWTVQLFLEEVAVVRRALGLDQIHLLGQSWGGMLAMEYALTKPNGLMSLIVSNSPASILQWIAEANRLRAELPDDVQQTLLKHETAGTTGDPAYQEAMMVLYRKHVCRLVPWPDYVNRTFQNLAQNPEVYLTMNGPSEFHVIGTLKTWDITNRLGEIRVPTIVIGGWHDEATPAITERVHRGIHDSEWVIFENSSHMPFVEETERYMETLNRFLLRVENQSH